MAESQVALESLMCASRGWENVKASDLAHRTVQKSRRRPLERARIEYEARSAETQARGSKYRNVRVVVNGERFDSQREAAYWQGLLARQAAGEITHLERQVHIPLYCPIMAPDGFPIPGSTSQVATYVADFTWVESGKTVICDAKGKRLPMYTLKKRWLYAQNGIAILEV